jgi:Fic family protein
MKRIESAPLSGNEDGFNVVTVGLVHLANQIGDPLIDSDLVTDITNDYLYWDKIKYKQIPAELKENIESNEALWGIVKMLRRASYRRLSFGTYKFNYFITSQLQELLHRFDLELGGQFGGHSTLPNQDKQQYLISSIMEEAIASSQIEGAVTTRKVAKELLRKNISPRDKSQQMIVNNYQTIRHLSEIKHQPMTPELLCQIQSMITKNALDNPQYEGRFRDTDDVTIVDVLAGETVHIPPKSADLPGLIQELCAFFNNNGNKSFIHPIVRASILHFMVAYIHPFVDGNGRTARTVFYWYLLKERYWLVEYLSISRVIAQSKTKYYRAFLYTEQDENDLTYFIHYQLHTLMTALTNLQKYIKRKVAEKSQAINFQRLPHINERQAVILNELHNNLDWVFNVKEIENRFAVSNQTARTDVSELVHLGYITAVKVNSKTQKFYKSNEFDSLISAK